MTDYNINLIFTVIVTAIGTICGGLAGRYLIYLRLCKTNLAGEEEEASDGSRASRGRNDATIGIGCTLIATALVFVISGGSVPSLRVKTEMLIAALLMMFLGIGLIVYGLGKK